MPEEHESNSRGETGVGWRVPGGVFRGERLSVEEAAELASQLAELARAGLPLPAGLRAVADELPRGVFRTNRVAGVLREMAGQVERGGSLGEAVLSQAARLPPSVHGLLLAGVRSGQLAEALEEFVGIERQQIEIRGRLGQAAAYPLLLLGVAACLGVLFLLFIVPQFAQIFREFDVDLPSLTRAIVLWSEAMPYHLLTVGLLGVLLLAMRAFRHVRWVQGLLDTVPLLGKMWRSRRLVCFSRWMGMLLDRDVALPDAIRLTAEATPWPDIRLACGELLRDVEAGWTLSAALADNRELPPTLRPLIVRAEGSGSLGAAFRAAAAMYEAQSRTQLGVLEAFLPVATSMSIASMAGLMILAMLMPLIALIQKLT